MSEKKSKFKNIITSIVVICAVAGMAFAGYKLMNDDSTSPSESTVQELKKVNNFTYDATQNKYTWDDVVEADGYIIKINGDQFEVVDNEYSYIPTTQTTEAQVRATDSTGTYASSDWSDVYTYTVPQNQMTLADVYTYVKGMLPDTYKLDKIVSINIIDNVLYTEAVFTEGSTSYLYKLQHQYDHNLESVADAIDEEMPDTFIRGYSETANYDSASYLLQSNEFVGELEEYRQQGYNISVVSSQTVASESATNGSHFFIYATYKLDSGSDVIYAKSTIRCDINNPSTNEQINYTLRLKDSSQRLLEELNFEIIYPEAVSFAEMMDNTLNQPSKM